MTAGSRLGLGALAVLAATAACSGGPHARGAASSGAGATSGASGPTTTAAAACAASPGLRPYCGAGTVSVRLGGRSDTISAADCEIDDTSVTVDAGTLVLSSDAALRQHFAYVGLQVGRTAAAPASTPPASSDGTYPALMSIDDHGVVASVPHAEAVLTGNRRHGTISGTSLSGSPVEVTYSC